MPISRRWGGTVVTTSPSMAMSPRSGDRKPATRLSSVVLPQPEGPSSVISSPRRIGSCTSCSAVTSLKRLTMPSRRTAMSCRPSSGTTLAAAGAMRSAGMLNVEDLSETEVGVGERQQRRGGDNVHDRQGCHRGVGVLAYVVVHGDGQRLRALGGDEQRGRELVERQDGGEQPAADEARGEQR